MAAAESPIQGPGPCTKGLCTDMKMEQKLKKSPLKHHKGFPREQQHRVEWLSFERRMLFCEEVPSP